MLKNRASILHSCIWIMLLDVSAANAYRLPLAQSNVEEPQYVNQFDAIGPEGKLIPLETASVTMETKSHNRFITNSVTSNRVVAGASSSVRLPSTVHFVIKVPAGSDSVDPNTVVKLTAFVVENGKRAVPVAAAKGGMFQGVHSESATAATIALTFKKYGTSSLEIIPAQPLPPGEYTIGGVGLGQSATCFGVDAK